MRRRHSPSPAPVETPAAAEAEIANHFCQKHAGKGDHRTTERSIPPERITKVIPTAIIQERHYQSGYCRSLLWKQNRELGQTVEITQHKDADGDHQWQLRFITVTYPFNQTDKALRLTISTQSTTTAFTTWFISGGNQKAKFRCSFPE